jgi:hypothetical protein
MEVVCDEFGFDTGDYFDSLAARRDSEMAPQPRLGLWSKRRSGSASDYRFDLAAVEDHIEE